jgi:radical SAM protein with 4Fe4S-binding SPASM domain
MKADLRASAIEAALYVPSSLSSDDLSLFPEFPQFEKATQELGIYLTKHFGKGNETKAFASSKFPPNNLQCQAGIRVLSIDPIGNIYPCQSLHKKEFLCGNILHDDLKEIYRESEVLRNCRRITAETKIICSECDLKYICGGGCKALAYNLYGNLNAHNQLFCRFLRKIAIDTAWAMARIPIEETENL